MHHFPCTPDCPLEIWADWLEDHDVDPGEIRLMAMGWWFFTDGETCGYVNDSGWGDGVYYFGDGYHYPNGKGFGNGWCQLGDGDRKRRGQGK